MFSFQQKIIRCEETGKYDPYTEKKLKQPKYAVFEKIQVFDLAEKDFKADIKNMFKVLKETMFKKLREK